MSRIYRTFLNNQTAIRRIIAKYRPDKHDVDDLTQETFLKCFAAEISQEIQNPKAFMFRVAKNVAISEARRKRNFNTDSFEDSGGIDVYPDREQITPDDALHSRRKLAVFVEALSTMPTENRRALVMRKIEGLKFKQIAVRLGVSVSTIEKRVAAALVHCNSYMRKKGYNPSDFGAAQTQYADLVSNKNTRRSD